MTQYHFEKRFDPGAAKAVEVRNTRGRVRISGWEHDFISVESRMEFPGHIAPEQVMPGMEIKDSTLHIRSVSGTEKAGTFRLGAEGIAGWVGAFSEQTFKSLFRDILGGASEDSDAGTSGENDFSDLFSGLTGASIKTDFTIYVPVKLDVSVQCTSGVIECSGLDGDITVKAMNGPVRFNSGMGNAVITAMNGPVALEAAAFRNLTVKTMNGPIRLRFSRIQGDILAKSMNGPIRMTIPETASIRLQVKTLSGPVKIPASIASEIRGLHQFSGRLHSGDHSVYLKTLSGPVSVALASSSISQQPPDSSVSTEIPDSPEPASPPPDPDGSEAKDISNDSEAIIMRMLTDGKITQNEAEQLRAKL